MEIQDVIPTYYCNKCMSIITPMTDVDVAEYENEPRRRKEIQGQESKWRFWKAVTIVGSICSILGLIYLMSSLSYE